MPRRRAPTVASIAAIFAFAALPAGGPSRVEAAGAPARLAFLPPMIQAVQGVDERFGVVVAIVDANGAVVTEGVSATVTLRVESAFAPGATLTCPGGLSRPTVTSGPDAGTASFAGCTLPSFVDVPPAQPYYHADLIAEASNVVWTAVPPPAIEPARETIVVNPILSSINVTFTDSGAYPAVIWGDTVTVRVEFTANGANKPVELQQTTRGMTTWTRLANLVTDSSGVATYSYRPSVSTRFRAVFSGSPDLPAGASESRGFLLYASAKQVPANAVPKVILRGSTVNLTTTARPILPELAPAVVQFRLYHRVSGTWKLASTRRVTVDASGIARLHLKFGARGEWYVRSVVEPRWFADSEFTAPAMAWASRPTPIARFSVR